MSHLTRAQITDALDEVSKRDEALLVLQQTLEVERRRMRRKKDRLNQAWQEAAIGPVEFVDPDWEIKARNAALSLALGRVIAIVR